MINSKSPNAITPWQQKFHAYLSSGTKKRAVVESLLNIQSVTSVSRVLFYLDLANNTNKIIRVSLAALTNHNYSLSMKLEKILDQLGALDKNAFIKNIDSILSNKPGNQKQIEQILAASDGGIKSVDNSNIVQLFSLIEPEFINLIKSEFRKTSSQLDIVIDIIIQDGNAILKQDWFSRLYETELKSIRQKTKLLQTELENEKSELSTERKRDYRIYLACLNEAYRNDIQNNQEAKITSDELSILVTLAKQLELSQDEIKLMNYLVIEPRQMDIQHIIDQLKNIGVIFYSKKNTTIYVADEMVRVLRKVRKIEVAHKFLRRVLRLLKDPQINLICKKHAIDRKLSTQEKIEVIITNGVSLKDILAEEIHKEGTPSLEKRRFINEFCDKQLTISPPLKGTTIDEKLNNLLLHFENIEKDEKVGISIDGYTRLITDLKACNPEIEKALKTTLNQPSTIDLLNTEYLLDRNLKPTDLLELIPEELLSAFCTEKGIKTRGEKIENILEAYTDSENIYIENYENIGYRDLQALKEAGLQIKEADLGILFEDITKNIFSRLGLNTDDSLKKKLNTSKDKMDILIQVENNEIIIVECKTQKEAGYNKLSSVSRQIKSYKEMAETAGFRVIKTILVAPEFSDTFISECDENLITSELHLSLITSRSLVKILEGFKNQEKYSVFPHQLFLRDLIIDENRIIKAISK